MRPIAKRAKKAAKADCQTVRVSKPKRKPSDKSLAGSVNLPYRPKSFSLKTLRKVVAAIHS
jgi:hypothetical protein